MSEKLRPCPFCGSEDVENTGNYVKCRNCLADGPFNYTNVDEAAENWNTRTTDDVMLDAADEIEGGKDPCLQWLVKLLREEAER